MEDQKSNRISLVALLTDFGQRDWYAGTLKGIIKGVAPDINIVDLGHDISSFDINEASFFLWATYKFFPEGTVFCIVIDPGVGSDRKPICATDGKYFFVCPDNGLLTYIANESPESFSVYKIKNPGYMLEEAGKTFHGRDIFAPVAARLAAGAAIEKMGSLQDTFIKLKIDKPAAVTKSAIEGKVIYIDTFGNLITNIRKRDTRSLIQKSANKWKLKIKGKKIRGISKSFSDKKKGKALFYWGSTGNMEIAVNQGSAKKKFGAGIGTPVFINLFN